MTQGDTADVVIIGAGIIGCSIALALRRRGFDTLNVDALPSSGQGSTSYSAAIIRPYYSTIEGSALAYESHFYWRDWGKFLGRTDMEPQARYNQCGCLVLMERGESRLLSTRRILDEVGVPYDVLTPDDVSARLPNICLSSFAPPKRIDDADFGAVEGGDLPGAIFCPTGGFVNDPMLACQNLAHAAQSIGARFAFNSQVAEINVESGAVKGVTLRDGRKIHAPIVVNAAGPHSSKINALAGVSTAIQTRALRQEVAHVPAPPAFDSTNGFVIADPDAGIYLRTEVGGHLLIGSLEPACDTLEWSDPDGVDTNHTEQWTNQVWRAALRFPELGIPNTASGFVALYDTSTDWIPIYDKSDVAGYFMAIGTSGNQFKNAPVVGQLMAELIEVSVQGRDHDADPVSFHLQHIGRDISLKPFSRNRPVNLSSSFSVLG